MIQARIWPTVWGVDFSGARLAGRTIWLARLEVPVAGLPPLRELHRLEDLCGTALREPALAFLVAQVRGSDGALWGMDFPFALPVEVMPAGANWSAQLAFVREYLEAPTLGRECLRRAREIGEQGHLRRLTDREAKTPFNPYHYRVIYQIFHGMRDVLAPLHEDEQTAIFPFHPHRMGAAQRVVVEACPSSTLKRLGLPHQNYKQPEGGSLTPKRRTVRRAILEALEKYVKLSKEQKRKVMADAGGDALDAILAALGALRGWQALDAESIARHPRYAREGIVFA